MSSGMLRRVISRRFIIIIIIIIIITYGGLNAVDGVFLLLFRGVVVHCVSQSALETLRQLYSI